MEASQLIIYRGDGAQARRRIIVLCTRRVIFLLSSTSILCTAPYSVLMLSKIGSYLRKLIRYPIKVLQKRNGEMDLHKQIKTILKPNSEILNEILQNVTREFA